MIVYTKFSFTIISIPNNYPVMIVPTALGMNLYFFAIYFT